MIDFDNLTDEQLVALSLQEIGVIIDYRCALSGVPLLPIMPTNKPTEPKSKTIEAYEVAGYYFVNKKQATDVFDLLNKSDLYTTDGYNETVRLRKVNKNDVWGAPRVGIHEIMTPESYIISKDAIEVYQRQMEMYKEAENNYNKAMESRKSIIDSVHEAISDASIRISHIEHLRSDFERYVELAEGNKALAFNFLVNAKSMTPDEKDIVYPEWDAPRIFDAED